MAGRPCELTVNMTELTGRHDNRVPGNEHLRRGLSDCPGSIDTSWRLAFCQTLEPLPQNAIVRAPAQPLSLPLACQVTASSPEARAQPEPLRSCPKESDHVAGSLAERPGNGRGLWDNGWQATRTPPPDLAQQSPQP